MILLNDLEKKINIISIGDYIEDGKYLIHSSFKNSINFQMDKKIITIGNRFIGSGPTNIIFNDISNFKFNSSIIKNNDLIIIGDLKFKIDKTKFYDSSLKISEFNLQKFYKNLNLFENYVKVLSDGKGLSPLLENKFVKNEQFVNKFTLKIKRGIEKIFDGDLLGGIKDIKGVGIGLTPSGDDFIYGFLTGLSIIEIIQKRNLRDLKKLIYENAKTENLISNNFLYFASEGLFFEKTKNLIISLFYGDESEILESVTKVLQIGETSGVDFSVGLIITLKKGGEDVCKRFN